MRRARLFGWVFLGCLAGVAVGQEAGPSVPDLKTHPVFSHPLDDEARASLHQGMGKRLAEVSLLRADFVQRKKIQALRRPLVSRGTFLHAEGLGVSWKFLHPFPSHYIVTEKGIYQIQEDGTREQVVSIKEQPMVEKFSTLFSTLFTGNTREMESQFDLHFEGNDAAWTLGLEPHHLAMKQLIARVVIRGGVTVEEVILLESNDDITDILFTNVQAGGELSDGERGLFEAP